VYIWAYITSDIYYGFGEFIDLTRVFQGHVRQEMAYISLHMRKDQLIFVFRQKKELLFQIGGINNLNFLFEIRPP